ncbi:MAG: hypothetical protein ACKV1O_26220 [Saprospiraceae bacterium]|jgi:ribosome assembly protein YihI (activator of Der GTPase)
MSHNEKEELIEEQRILKILLDFHVKNRANISMSDSEFQEYVNVVLDRLNELTRLLAEIDDVK